MRNASSSGLNRRATEKTPCGAAQSIAHQTAPGSTGCTNAHQFSRLNQVRHLPEAVQPAELPDGALQVLQTLFVLLPHGLRPALVRRALLYVPAALRARE